MYEETFVRFLPRRIKQFLLNSKMEMSKIQEIKIRIGKPIMVLCDKGESIVRETTGGIYIVTELDLREMLEYISNYSLYAYEEEMRQGFITVEGGHRIGLCGQTIYENGRVKNLRYISSINVRIAHEIKGCADEVLPYLVKDKMLLHTMIISPPGCGKTTLLRDIIRQISDGNTYVRGVTVGVVDERSEIGGSYKGIPQIQLGLRTDILDGCPKAEGMLMLIRSMGPKVIAVDEIGTKEDVHAVEYAMYSGCKMIATVHGKSLDEVRDKPELGRLIRNHGFERYVILGNMQGVGSVEGIYDENGRSIVNYRNDEYMGYNKSGKSQESVGKYEVPAENYVSYTK